MLPLARHEIERLSNIWLTLRVILQMFKHYLLEHHVFCSYQNIAKLDDFTGMDRQHHLFTDTKHH
ncbi:hypothetical protein CFP56_043805 [Quercus suber]|uniref:Uncharacterized protein n=1 Tax=Quercus suber TaxID=58331 RepID=A0AAW0LIM3_QUESU